MCWATVPLRPVTAKGSEPISTPPQLLSTWKREGLAVEVEAESLTNFARKTRGDQGLQRPGLVAAEEETDLTCAFMNISK